MNEFDIIRRFFTQSKQQKQVKLGIGDDAAVCCPTVGQDLVIAVDTLNQGVHFPIETTPEAIGYKALAVNLSDMAAMGAQPLWFTLSLSLPETDENWLAGFSQSLLDLATQHDVSLIGGDTTRGALSISIQIIGQVPTGQALRRSGAQVGDVICVTGKLGGAGLALQHILGKIPLKLSAAAWHDLRQTLDYPIPRVAEGLILRDFAHSAIDISDGLAADLGHLLTTSQVGACIDATALPLSPFLSTVSAQTAQQLAWHAGDEYELCFTVAPAVLSALQQVLDCTVIGVIETKTGLRVKEATGNIRPLSAQGYVHFMETNADV